ncbi:Protein CBR-SRAB-25 [Caenorhabditis briggsae]|uniref:Protein CBR-SRAB-25 n=1 Tax=Caenorhabditis briggsae TaxID=6238 RepID=A8Y0Z4_CAEBR|nr:Protein CBR-SRAB-25 [Caenorhabditis briggsae]CAP38563.2 Protein CBR-SRAB-25 [Caenorhabditis briggsae]
MPPPQDSTCNETEVLEIQNSTFLHISETVMLVLSIIALPILVVAIQKCVTNAHFHLNIRIIAAAHCISILLHCIGRIIQNSSDMYLWMGPLTTCNRRQFIGICVISRSLCSFGIYYSSFTTVFIALERTIATHFTKKYENKKSKYGIAFVVIQALISVIITFGLFYETDLPNRPVYCILNSDKPWTVSAEIITMSSNLFAFVQCYRMYKINMKLRIITTQTTLSQKYTIEENKTLIQISMRFTCLDFVFMIIYFMKTIITEMNLTQRKDYVYAICGLTHCAPVYAIVVILAMQRIIKKIQTERVVKLKAEVEVKDDAYFYFFKQQWSQSK